jgi:hypothetical protein
MGRTEIERIIAITEAMERFWRKAHGWAPADAAEMMEAARLDRQVSFTRTLTDYLKPFPDEEAEARQILGYATLRSLCEGILKLFFSVWWEDYRRDIDAAFNRQGKVIAPEDVSFDRLITLYSRKGDPQVEVFLRRIQQRGNAIHHFTDREIGSQSELITDIGRFLEFLLAANTRLPYPDDAYNPARA